jgi:hypothetical protein
VPLQKLTGLQIRGLYTAMLAGGRADGRGTSKALSPRTVRYTRSVLSKALKQAVRWRLIAHNPCDDADPPKDDAASCPSSSTRPAPSTWRCSGWSPRAVA